MNNPNEIIIIGGGNSINEGIKLGLKDKLKDKFVIACNYAYKHFPYTFMCCVDKDFYIPIHAKNNPNYPDIYEELKSLPLIISINNGKIKEFKHSNTYLLRGCGTYHGKNSLKKGIYRPNLCGLFALTLAHIFIDFKGIIFLLGYDWTIRDKKKVDPKNYKSTDLNIKTHYYSNKELTHRGQGYVGFYENHDPHKYFQVYKEPEVKIYNVSPNSNINSFAKINYEEMFELLNKESYNQEKLRKIIKNKLRL